MNKAKVTFFEQYTLDILPEFDKTSAKQKKNARHNAGTSRSKQGKEVVIEPPTLVLDIPLESSPVHSPKPSIVAKTTLAEKLELDHLRFRGDRLTLHELEPKARTYYRYLLVTYGYFVAENYVNLVSPDDYKGRCPVLKDSYEDSINDEDD